MNLQKKVGPLPVWAWGAAIGLGILVYYLRTNSSGSYAATTGAVSTPTLDPTQGAFDLPAGLSSGGLSPELAGSTYVPSAGDIADAVSQQLAPVLATLPAAAVPNQPQDASTQSYDPVGDTTTILSKLKDAGLIGPFPVASTGAATSQPQTHKAPAKVVTRVNDKKGNPRSGMTYKVVVNPKGHPKGTYHVYGKSKYIRVKK